MHAPLENPPIVLIVKDDPAVLELLVDLLEPEGYKIFQAQSARRALELTATIRADIILCDVVMPEMNGLELCQRLKSDPKTSDIPVMLVSAVRKEEAARLEGFSAGADDYLEIPFRNEELLIKVARLVERHQVERRYREIVEQAADIIYTRDMDGCITSINEAGARFFGKPVTELLGQPLNLLIGEDAAAHDIAKMKSVQSFEPVRSLHRLKNALGEQRYLEGLFTVERDVQGEAVGVRGVVRDITELKQIEQALKESEARYRVVAETASDAIITIDETSTILFANSAAEKIFGYQVSDMVGASLTMLMPEYLREIHSAGIKRYVTTGKRHIPWSPVAVIGLHREGHEIPLEISFGELKTGDRRMFTAVVRDITERKRVEAALQAQNEEYRILFQSNPRPMWVCDVQTLAFLAVNDAAIKHYGYSREEFLAMTVKDIRPPEEISALVAQAQNNLGSHDYAGVWKHLTKDGTLIDVEINWHKIDFAGKPSYLVLANDVTEKNRSELALRESEHRYREIFDNANDIIYTHDLEGNFTSLNQTGSDLTGYSKAEVANFNFAQVVVPEQVELARQMLGSKLKNNEVATVYELDILSKHGRRLTLELSTRLIYRDGKPVGVQGIARDVSERKRAEAELRRRNRELAALNEIGHELSKLVEPAEIAQLIHAMIGKVMDNRNLYVALYDEQKEEVSFPAYTIDGQPYHSPTRKLGLGLTEYVIRTKKPLHIPRDLEGTLKRLGLILSGRSAQCWLAVPMMVGEKVVGVITLQDYEKPEAYDSAHLDLLWTIASHAAIVVENARLYAEMKQHADRTALTNRISQAVRRTLEVSEVFDSAVRELGSHLGVDRCSLFMKDERTGRVTNVAEYHVPDVVPAGHDFDMAQVGGLRAAMQEHGVLAFDDVAGNEKSRMLYEGIVKRDVKSIMYVGVTVGEELLGAFALSTTKQLRRWSDVDIEVAKSVADQTGIAIRQARLYQKSESTSAREALVNKLGGAIRSSLSLTAVLDTTVRELGKALAASRVQVRLCDGVNENVFVKTEYATGGNESPGDFEGYYDRMLREHFRSSSEPLVISDVQEFAKGDSSLADGVRFHANEQDLRSTFICPLTVNDKFRGVICIEQTDAVRHWTEDEVLLVKSVAAQLATGIAQAELFEIVARAKHEWETTFDAMSDGIFIFDPNGQLLRVNRAGANMDNSAPQTILGRKCCEILRTSADDAACIVEQAVRDAQSVNVEVVPQHLNRPVLVTVEPLFDASRQVLGAVCTARDLSELRKIEAVARERQSLLKNILESAREAIYALDVEGNYKWCNQAMLDLTGYSHEEFIGRNFLERVHEDDRLMRLERFAATLAGEPQTYESRYIAYDGAVRYALVNSAPIIVDGQTTGVLGIAHDITEQKQERDRAARADKLRALGQLASGVAHDFNNSLAAILGRAQLILRRVKDEELIRSLGIIVTAAEDAASTVRRIQTFARKSLATEMELLDVSALLRDAVEITRTRWQNEARAAGRSVEVTLNAVDGSLTRGNASELREVFVNLIVNAVDAMPQGGKLTICCRRKADRLHLRFADTGTGMEEEVRERIFEPFYTTKGVHGTGLGLAVSYGIVERHHGMISVTSELGEGTTFHIDLPLAEMSESAVAEAQMTMHTSSLSVLVVDDEEVVRETLAEMLTDLDHKVVTADSGRDAVEKVTSDDFDLVFTDLAMPEMDGWETAREIRKQKPQLPVVLVTGYGATAQPPSGEVDLVAGIIGKPFDFDQVTGTIARVVAQ